MKKLKVQGFAIEIHEDLLPEEETKLDSKFDCVDGKVVIYDYRNCLTDEGALVLVKYLKDEGLINSLSVWCEIIS